MRVLIVDGFTKSRRGREAFNDFKYTITKALEGPYYKYLTAVALAVRNYRQLDEFLFDMGGNGDSSCLKAFQNLDMIFIGCDEPALVPWGEAVKGVRLLLRQCIQYGTPTFATGFASHLIPYLVQLRGEHIRVINGCGLGGSYNEISALPAKVKKSALPPDTFLDAENGDIYQRKEYCDFKHVGNVGVYNPKLKQGRNVYKTRPSTVPGDDPVAARRDECVVELSSTRYANHWILRDLPKRFVGTTSALWMVHDKISQRMQSFLVSRPNSLPQLIGLDQTIFGCQFGISRKYPETMQLLLNFATHYCEEMIRNPGKRVGAVGTDILSNDVEETTVSDMWEEKLEHELKRRKAQQTRVLQEADLDEEVGNIGGFPVRALTAGRESMSCASASAKAPASSSQNKENQNNYTDDFAALFASSGWPLPAETAGGATSSTSRMPPKSAPSRSKLRSRPVGRGASGSVSSLFKEEDTGFVATIRKALETTEVNLMDHTRTFSKVEIRKMLHPEADVQAITPYVPPKVVRVVSRGAKPFTRWKYYEQLENFERAAASSRPPSRVTMSSQSATRPLHPTEYRLPPDQTTDPFAQLDGRVVERLPGKPSTAPNGKRPQGIPRPSQPRPFNAHVGRATSSRGIGTVIENYVRKTPGPSATEHEFRDAKNTGGICSILFFLCTSTRKPFSSFRASLHRERSGLLSQLLRSLADIGTKERLLRMILPSLVCSIIVVVRPASGFSTGIALFRWLGEDSLGGHTLLAQAAGRKREKFWDAKFSRQLKEQVV
ncbi:unnamed protein product [Amoebophrya sp. A120]|nr:unnamed protein product [Amoebophrya sp. A120]|eukprot:GSA120T00021602001.1